MIILSGGRKSALLLHLQVKFGSPCAELSFNYTVTPSVILRASPLDARSSFQLSLQSEHGAGARQRIWQLGLRFFSFLSLGSSWNLLVPDSSYYVDQGNHTTIQLFGELGIVLVDTVLLVLGFLVWYYKFDIGY